MGKTYRTALWFGYEQVKAREIKLPGTVLMNERTGETVYTPPSGEDAIRVLLSNL